jgi:hypothetical protein
LIYDFEKKHLRLDTESNTIFDLRLRGPVNVIKGDSATGKTYLTDFIWEAAELGKSYSSAKDVNNIFSVKNKKEMQEALKCEGQLIIIDDADNVLDSNSFEINHINNDRSNHYLIFARKPLGLRITPNYCGVFEHDDDTVTIKYLADFKEWF